MSSDGDNEQQKKSIKKYKGVLSESYFVQSAQSSTWLTSLYQADLT